MKNNRARVVVAMSGGVDSSVAAALLIEAGYDCLGATLNLHDDRAHDQTDACGGSAAVDDARRVAAQLGIPHHVLDARHFFRERVLRPGWEAYAAGRTPNPCVACNEHVKFGLLRDFARSLGAEKIATGHYARLVPDPATGVVQLRRGRDRHKDQSYFLYALSPEQRAAALLPLGDFNHKDEVRDLARRLGLPVAERRESQDACFAAGDLPFSEMLRRTFAATAAPGPILDEKGNRLGDHAGIHLYTIGQRQGLGVALGRPAWIKTLDPKDATVVLTTDPDALLSPGLLAADVHWSREPLALNCRVQIRYRHQAREATVEPLPDRRARVLFAEPQHAVTPGQAAVFYDNDLVIGGGTIIRGI